MARKLRITQTRSRSGRTEDQIGTLRALGIRRHQQSVTKDDTPQIRGMIFKVRHLVRVEELH
jgi:large subunit ribosomal protein L30